MNGKKLIVESGVRMITGGYTLETWGNISCRDPQTGLIYLTPSGMDYSRLTEDDIAVCRLDGTAVEGIRRPTVEKELHLGVYRARPEINAVIHTHSVYSTVFAVLGMEIPMLIDEAAQALGDVCRCTDYALPGSEELARKCVEALSEKSYACLLKSHGAVCIGETMEKAFKAVKVLETTARVYQMVLATGRPFDVIGEENVKAMQDFVKNVYGQR